MGLGEGAGVGAGEGETTGFGETVAEGLGEAAQPEVPSSANISRETVIIDLFNF